MRVRLTLVLGVLALNAVPAGAAEVTLTTTITPPQTRCDRYCTSSGTRNSLVRVTDPAGAADDLTVAYEGQVVTVTAVGPLDARAGCEAVDASTVRCTPPEPPPGDTNSDLGGDIEVDAGGGDDRVTVIPASLGDLVSSKLVRVEGGAGSDTLETPVGSARGGPGKDRLRGYAVSGDAGDDELRAPDDRGAMLAGGPGDDLLLGGEAGDTLMPGTGTDRVEGGPGHDTASATYESQPVWFDLGGSPTPAPGYDADVLNGVEDAYGSLGDDTLIGDGGDNELGGGDGRDRLVGRGGNDDLDVGREGGVAVGGRGNDGLLGVHHRAGTVRLLGGPGADRLTMGSGGIRGAPGDVLLAGPGDDAVVGPGAARYGCGSGRDSVNQFRGTVVPVGCERLVLFALRPRVPVPALRPGGLEVTVSNPCGRTPCAAVVAVRGVGRAKTMLRSGSGRQRVLLPANPTALLGRVIRVQIGTVGDETPVRFRVRLPGRAGSTTRGSLQGR